MGTILFYGLFTLPDMDTDSDSDLDPDSRSLYPFLRQICVPGSGSESANKPLREFLDDDALTVSFSVWESA